ncbi:MAG: ABC transporter permease [Candidatus Nanopelagicales bacterium]|jgi:simple sugar transport system permease protein|nr:ABC transporter permease [Candidatus Nanopelagicales bacterium]MBJ7393199.1 ABC transporter permease [Candidatus Nanopelagicales bacterium]
MNIGKLNATNGFDLRDFIVKYGFILVTVILFVWFASTEPTFRMQNTLFSMLKFTSVVAITGLGVTLTMVVGGLDLSVGAIAGLSVTLSAMTMVIYAQTGAVALVVVLLGGALVGLFNAFLIVVLKIPDLLATLATMFTIMGLKLVPVDGQSVSSGLILRDGSVAPGKFTPGFLLIDRAYLGPVPLPVAIFFFLAFVVWIFLTKTRWGRVMYAIGSNPEAARLAGVRVQRYRALAYALSGVFASIGGLILSSRIGQGDISAGNSLLLDAVAVSLVGTSVLGMARPNAWGTTLGAVLIGIVITGLTIKGFPYYAQDVVKGLVLLTALIFSFTLSRRKSRFVPAV